MGCYGVSNRTNEEAYFSSTASLNFSSGPSSSSMLISSIEDKGRGIVKLESGAFVETREDNFAAGFFPSSGCEETAVLSDNITSLKRLRDENEKVFSGLNPSEIQVKNLDQTCLVFCNLMWDFNNF